MATRRGEQARASEVPGSSLCSGKKERTGRRRRAAAAGGARWGRCGSGGDGLGRGSETERERVVRKRRG
jgi:hypothetical protein